MARSIEDSASKGVAGAGLGLGIAGTALALLRGGGLFGGWGLGGNGGEVLGAAALAEEALDHIPGLSCPTAWQVEMKECEDVLNMANQRCDDLRTIDKQFFDLELAWEVRRHQDYKEDRDRYDVLADRIGKVECETAVNRTADHYERIITKMQIDNARAEALVNLDRRTCRMISGEVVLPSGDEVTGLPAVHNGFVPYRLGGGCCGFGGGVF